MINCSISSTEKTLFYENVRSITLPAFSGEMQILPDYAESFVLLNSGNIIVEKQNKQTETLKIESGECHIKNNEIKIVL